ncbi:1873_t:CDS:1 [Dentiscutata erythropus]|uniref:1873_t:CDS:1 n=1 Tax=Dentiscutata erythropus TaxID=1348616 RepID=A0A9N9N8K8_9GLOM|nr:1873_t:CDS:1 [Dentiscutata erythropus]
MCNWCCKKKNECPCPCPEYKKKFGYKKEKPPPESSVEESDDEYYKWKNNWEWESTYHKNYKWCKLCYEAKRYSKSTSHNSYNCRYRKTEPFVKKFKCSFCSKLYFPKYHDEGFICWKYLPYDDPRCWNPNWYKDDENN